MAFITKDQVKRYRRGFSVTGEYVAYAQKNATASNADSAESAIFLSHSHKDSDLVDPVIAFLRSHGASVYIDWIDEGMPDVVSGDTATVIKKKIREQEKFVLMVTENSKDSRWVPWELGYADPVKGMDHIAILPVAEQSNFEQNEYMKIYPKIQIVENTWWVWRDDPIKLVSLVDWLKK